MISVTVIASFLHENSFWINSQKVIIRCYRCIIVLDNHRCIIQFKLEFPKYIYGWIFFVCHGSSLHEGHKPWKNTGCCFHGLTGLSWKLVATPFCFGNRQISWLCQNVDIGLSQWIDWIRSSVRTTIYPTCNDSEWWLFPKPRKVIGQLLYFAAGEFSCDS